MDDVKEGIKQENWELLQLEDQLTKNRKAHKVGGFILLSVLGAFSHRIFSRICFFSHRVYFKNSLIIHEDKTNEIHV